MVWSLLAARRSAERKPVENKAVVVRKLHLLQMTGQLLAVQSMSLTSKSIEMPLLAARFRQQI